MMGNKKPSEYKTEILEAFAREGLDPEKYFQKRLAELENSPVPKTRELETLLSLRDGLLGELHRPKRAKREKTKR